MNEEFEKSVGKSAERRRICDLRPVDKGDGGNLRGQVFVDSKLLRLFFKM